MAAEIIGRRDELLALESFLAASPAGGQALLLEGDAGIGKTVLWEEALCLAGERNFRVLRSRPTQSDAQVAFAAVGDLLAPASVGMVAYLSHVRVFVRQVELSRPVDVVVGVLRGHGRELRNLALVLSATPIGRTCDTTRTGEPAVWPRITLPL